LVLTSHALAWAPSVRGAEVGAELRNKAALRITAEDLRSHVYLLADDSLEGREAGSRGGYTAGNYLARTMQKHLEPAAEGGQYFQLVQGRYRNILGIWRGSDPQLRAEYILVGAHYDHVGYGTARNSNGPIGIVHNGADDNASGSAALVAIVEALANSELRPRRSILFALWDGEEKGLLGSEYWAQHPTVPLSQVKLAINIDMLGRLESKSLEVQGTRTMAGLRHLVAQANLGNDLSLHFSWDIAPNSDHYTFLSRRIPVLMYHTGLHSDYHRPSDDAERVDLPGLESATRLVFNSVIVVCDAEKCSAYRVAAANENEAWRRSVEAALPPPRPRLGLAWEPFVDADQSGLRILSVTPGSPAARAGIRVGDRLIAANGLPLLSASTLQQLAVSATQIQLELLRGAATEPQTIAVPLDGTPARLGISWREDAAEPGSVTVVRVIKHSVADQAGLRVADRILQLDGASFQDARQFRDLTQSVQLPASVLVERAGRMRELVIPSLRDASLN
jgi:hypothetical protein